MAADRRTVLITGASGTIGSALSALLCADDAVRVVCLSRSPLQAPLPATHVSLTGDFAQRSDLERVTTMVGRVDCVVHLAGVLSEGNGLDFQLAVNVVGTHSLITHFRVR